MSRVGITGHQDLGSEADVAWVRAALNQVLSERYGSLTGVSSLARGADQLFAELVLARGGSLEAVIPFPDYRSRFSDEVDAQRFDGLLARSRADVLPREGGPDGGGSDEQAYLRAGQSVVERSDLLLAVWNGKPAAGLGGTADIVQHARARGTPTIVLDPLTHSVSRGQQERRRPLTDADLDSARLIGDPLVDPLIAGHLGRHGPQALGRTTGALFRASGLPEDDPLVRRYFDALADLPLGDADIISRGQRLFSLFGPEMFLVLGSCSLPLAFAAGNGVQAIYRARRLKDDPVRRLYDTAQMIINVMQVGQLEPGRLGWRSARKVRLIHALVRQLVKLDEKLPWSAEWGTPINQEDLAGTLLSFSVAVLQGLRRMGARITAQDGDAYVYAWSAIGRLLGVDEALLSTSEEEATALAFRIGNRQVRATPEGKQLAEQLMGAVATLFPIPGYANSLTHFFLQDSVFGEDVARVLDLPPAGWTRALVAARAWQKRKVLALLEVVPGARQRRSAIARRFVQAMILLKRPEGNVPFEVPQELAGSWGLRLRKSGIGVQPG